MNRPVEILKILAAMADHRARKRRPRFFRYFDGTRNEKLVVRDHRQRSTLNAQHSTSNLYRRSPAWVARASRVLVAVSRGDELFLSSCFTYDAEITCEVRERATPSPALGTSALPGIWRRA